MQITRDEDKKKKSQKLAGGQGPVTDCVAQNKKHLVPYRKRERGESTRILQPKSRTTLYVWMCVCAWMTILLYYNLLTTDYLAPQAGDWRWGARAPCCVHMCVFFLQSSVYLEQRICWWHAEGSDSDTGVCLVTHSLYTTVPRLHNKLKNKYN